MKQHLIFFIVLFSIPSLSKAQKIKRFPFSAIEAQSIENLSIIISIDTLQYDTQNGLFFSIRIKNSNLDSIIIRNPFDFLSINLLNDRGNRILFPYDSRVITSYKLPVSQASFIIEEAFLNGELYDSDISIVKDVFIPPNANFEFGLRIKDVLPAGLNKPYKLEQKIKIAKGEYTLICYLGIIVGEKKAQYGVKPIKINYLSCKD